MFENDDFINFRPSLDLECKESASEGVDVSKRQAEVIEFSEEETLWNIKPLGGDNPQQLLDTTLLYLNGLHFALRSGVEHRNLSIDQIQVPRRQRMSFIL